MKFKISIGVLIVLLVITGIVAGFIYVKYQASQQELAKLSNPQELANKQTQALIVKVGKLIELPTNETPTIVSVTNASKLKGQPFFSNVVNGDDILIYTKAKKAIIYRESINKVIEVAPVSIGNTPSPTPTPKK